METNTINLNNEINKPQALIENEIPAVKDSQSTFLNIKTSLKELVESIISPKEPLTFEEQLNDKFLNLDFGSEFNIDATKIGVNDAIFFVNLLNQQNLINYTVEDDKLNISDSNGKKIDGTVALLNMLKTSFDTKKSIRLDFDRNVTVILKLDKEGKIQAHFIPGTSEVENYLKNNISSLKQRFDEENINYSSLSYSQNKENKQKQKKRSTK